MLRIRTLFTLALSLLAVCLLAQSAAASVAYIDGNEVWVASDDGARKLRLSAGENDWRQVAQSDDGFIVGVRKEAGKISQLASFTVWNPSGQIVHFGALSGHNDAPKLNVYPLTLELTPGGGGLAYGYQRAYGPIGGGGLAYNTYFKPTADATTAVPASFQTADGTLIGSRLLGHAEGGSTVDLNSLTDGNLFDPWISYPLGDAGWPGYGLKIDRTDISATGTVTATELRDDSFYTQKIVMAKWSGVGGTYVDDCFLTTAGLPSDISISQDATTMTWRDDRGVVIAGVPDFTGPATCNLTRAPVALSATAVWPSYGPFNVPATSPTGVAKPTVTVASKIKLSTALKSGFSISVTSLTSGKAKASLTVKPSAIGKKGKKAIEIAKGSATVVAGVKKKLKLKFTKKGESFKKKLKGKKATLTVTVGGAKTTKTIKFK